MNLRLRGARAVQERDAPPGRAPEEAEEQLGHAAVIGSGRELLNPG
jgi:hypothetical protein